MALQINIDNGGTLTDICIIMDDTVKKTKVLTTPYDLSKCFFEGLQKASGVIYGEQNVARLLEEVDLIRYSTTQGTNAICERKGPRLGLIIDAKARDLPVRLAEHDPEVYEALVGDRVVFLDTAAVTGTDADIEVVKAINKLTAAGANRLVVSFGGANFLDLETAHGRRCQPPGGELRRGELPRSGDPFQEGGAAQVSAPPAGCRTGALR